MKSGTGAIFSTRKQSDKLFFPHYTMTDSEYGVWNYACAVSYQSKEFQCSARAMAARFKSMSKSTANRRINGLIKSGWFDVIEPTKRGKGGLWIPAKLRPLSPAEYQQRYAEVCKKAVDEVEQKLKQLDQCAVPAYSTGGTGDPVEDHPVSVETIRVPSQGDPVPSIDHPVPNQTLTWPAGGTEIECKTEIESEIKTEDKVEAKTGVSVGLSDVCSSTLEKVVINTSESQQVHKHPPEAAAISRANVAAHSDVSDTQADQPGAEGYQDTNRISTPVPESRLERGQLGIRISELMVPGPPSDTFVVISDVTPGGPAAKAGVQKGDIILVANQKGIKRVQDFSLIVGSSPPKAPVRLDTVRFGKGEPRRYFDVPIWPFVA